MMFSEGNLGIAIGLNFVEICDGLSCETEKKEFIEGMRFLIRQDLPILVILLYLAEYEKKAE